MKIRTIIAIRILVVAVAVVAMAGFLIGSWYTDSRDKTIASVGTLASAVAENTGQHVSDAEIILGLIAGRPSVRALKPESCDESMLLVRNSDPARLSISVSDSAGRMICTVAANPDGRLSNFSQREWFRRAMDENRFIASEPFTGRLTQRLVTVLAYPIRDDQGTSIGIVDMSYDVAKLHPMFETADLPSDMTITIVNRDGVVISRQPETDWIGRNIAAYAVFRTALSGVTGTGLGSTPDGMGVVFGYKAISKASWIAIVSQPVDTVLAQTRNQSHRIIWITGAVLIVILLAATITARLFVRQAGQIAATARAVADGNADARMAISSIDELATIAHQFNRMLDNHAESERRILKLNRLYAALSETNNTIIKVTDRQTMLERVCHIASERCKFSLVWIGLLDAEARSIVPVAHSGTCDGYFDGRGSILLRNPGGEGPLSRAIHDKRPVIVSDIETDSSASPWRKTAEAFGIRSVGIFPLSEGGKTIGLINLYSSEPDYFDDAELMSVIDEIASDLSFGLETLHREGVRRETEERFRQIAESIREVFWLTDPTKNKMLYISPAYSDIWGRDVEDLYVSPKNWLAAIHEADRARVLDAAMTKQTSGTYDEEYRIVRPDGGVRWIHDRAFPIRNEAGDVYRVAGIAEDITGRKKMEDAIRRSESTLAAAQALAGLGSWERDLVSGEAHWSDTMFGLLNCDPNLGAPSIDDYLVHVDPADRQKAIESHGRVNQTGKETFVEFRTHAAFGPVRQLRSTITPVKNSTGVVVGYKGILLDITQIKDAEARLFQAQKMEALGNLAGGIAHDFNNMLLPILNLTELSAEELPSDHPVQENLAMVIKAATRASQLVKQILTFGRRSERMIHATDIADGVEDALRLLRNTLPSTIKIVDQIEKDAGTVLVDPAELHSVILNLGNNAAHAMGGKKGELTIRVSRFCGDADFAERHLAFVPDQWFAKILIADTGHGMDAATIKKIFNPFFTTKPVGEGTGLGLAMVHGIVESMGGAIDVTSEIGIGTTFAIYLPLECNDMVVAP